MDEANDVPNAAETMPNGDPTPLVWDLVLEDLANPVRWSPLRPLEPSVIASMVEEAQRRHIKGIAVYGRPLKPFNGRESAEDLREELLDGLAYSRQLLVEQQALGNNDELPFLLSLYERQLHVVYALCEWMGKRT